MIMAISTLLESLNPSTFLRVSHHFSPRTDLTTVTRCREEVYVATSSLQSSLLTARISFTRLISEAKMQMGAAESPSQLTGVSFWQAQQTRKTFLSQMECIA